MVYYWIQKRRYLTQSDEIMERWTYSDEEVKYDIAIRHFYSNWGSAKQVIISKKNEKAKQFGIEPTMQEKEEILKATKAQNDITDCVAMEIFPKWREIVDNYDLYHIWLVNKKEIPFFVDIFKKPKFMRLNKKLRVDGVSYEYNFKNYSRFSKSISIFFVKNANGKELTWYQKQNFKDIIIGKNVISIEIIKYDKKISYSIIISVPLTRLPFGLTKKIQK